MNTRRRRARRFIHWALSKLRRDGRQESVPAMPDLRLHADQHPELADFDLAMLRRAIELANKAAVLGEVPVGAVIYRGEKIIAEAYNLRESVNDPTGHAELLAISKAGRALGEWRLTDCTLAVTLEPCPMCAGAMVNARLGRLIYGAADPKAGACETLYQIPTDERLNHRVKVIAGVLADECGALLTNFFKHKRRMNREDRDARSA